MKKGVFKMYAIKENKNRKSLYNRSTTYYPKHQDVEIKLNIVNAVTSDLSRGMISCAKDIISIVNNVMSKGN